MATPTYDPNKVKVTWGGIIIRGYADGTFIKAKRMTEAFKSQAGAGGEVARAAMKDKRGEITMTLMQTSQVNDQLSAIQLSDEANGTGIAPMSIEDLGGTTLLSTANAWLTKPSEVERGKDLANQDWKWECDELNIFVGGTNP